MKCPKCGQKTYVRDVRDTGIITRRDRSCAKCGFSFRSYELDSKTLGMVMRRPEVMSALFKEGKNSEKQEE